MPPLFEGSQLYMPTAPPGLSITEATRLLQVQDKMLRKFPEVERVFGTVGRGTYVSKFALNLIRQPKRRASNDLFWDGFFAEEQRDDSLGRLMASVHEPGVISFAAAHGSDELTPLDLVRRATDAVLRREGGSLLQYGSSDGYPPLKRYLQRRA